MMRLDMKNCSTIVIEKEKKISALSSGTTNECEYVTDE